MPPRRSFDAPKPDEGIVMGECSIYRVPDSENLIMFFFFIFSIITENAKCAELTEFFIPRVHEKPVQHSHYEMNLINIIQPETRVIISSCYLHFFFSFFLFHHPRCFLTGCVNLLLLLPYYNNNNICSII